MEHMLIAHWTVKFGGFSYSEVVGVGRKWSDVTQKI